MAKQKHRLTEEIAEKIALGVRAGAYREIAAQRAGIPPRVLYVWLDKGRDNPASAYGRLLERLDVAEADAEIAGVAGVRSKVGQDWRAASEFLRLRWPGRYAPQITIRVREEIDALLDVAASVLAEPDFVRLAEAIAARDGESTPRETRWPSAAPREGG